MNSISILDKIHSKIEDYNKYFYGPQNDVIFRFEQKFFVYQLLTVIKVSDLRTLLKSPLHRIENLINTPNYTCFSIPKKRGGFRYIQSPDDLLFRIQARMNFYLQQYYHLIKPKGVYGFVLNPDKKNRMCNIAENAKNHTNKKYVFNMDLKDFFPSIKAYRVKELFTSDYFKYNLDIANALALLTTYEGKLPTGAPTSPVLSNFICIGLDNDLNSLCDENDISYSRYADDLTFSSNKLISKDLVEKITAIIEQNDFTINPKKTRLKSENRKQSVTGLVVNTRVNVDRKLLKKIRAMLHDAIANGLSIATINHFKLERKLTQDDISFFMNRLDGYINFVSQIKGKEDSLFLKFKKEYAMLVRKEFCN